MLISAKSFTLEKADGELRGSNFDNDYLLLLRVVHLKINEN